MKSKVILLTMVLLAIAFNVNAQEEKYFIWGPGLDYGWGDQEIFEYIIDRHTEIGNALTDISTRTKDSIVYIHDFPRGYIKTTCLLTNDSLHTVLYDKFGQFVNEDPVNKFFHTIRRRELEPYWKFDVFLVSENKKYKEFRHSDIKNYLEISKASLYASRWVMNTFTEIMLTYEDDGYHIHYLFRQMW